MATPRAQDAIALLKADHRKVEGLFAKFEKAKASSRKKALAQQICLELSVHTKIEEDIFYPACQEDGVDEDLMNEAYDRGRVSGDDQPLFLTDAAQIYWNLKFDSSRAAVGAFVDQNFDLFGNFASVQQNSEFAVAHNHARDEFVHQL